MSIQDNAVQAEDIPLPLLTQEQIIALLPYISSLNALNTSDSILPVVQQEIPEITALSSSWLKHTALQQVQDYLTIQTIPTLCDLIIAASYLDIYNNEQTINFIELATQALGDKLLQAPQYQDEYDIINTLPNIIQYTLTQYLINTSALRYTLCSNSTNVIASTAQTLTGHISWIRSVSWSSDRKHIASCSNDKTIRVWDAQSGNCIHTLKGHTAGVYSVTWSPDSKYLASGAGDTMVKVWDTTTYNCIYILQGHTNTITSISWSPDSRYLASSSDEGTVRV